MRIMSEQTQDAKWTTIGTEVKVLTLEHMMAARRLGFSRFFAPLYKVSKYQMTFLQGSVSEIEFFTKEATNCRIYKRRWTSCFRDFEKILAIIERTEYRKTI